MDDLPRQKLGEIISRYGQAIGDDPRKCEGLLKDLCGEYRREIFVLVSALKERVAAELLAMPGGLPREVTLARLIRRLHDNLGLTEEVARWAVESWAMALGVMAGSEQPQVFVRIEKPAVTFPAEPARVEIASATRQVPAPADSDPLDPFDLLPTLTAEDQLRQALRAALADGSLTEQQKADLQTMRQRLNISADEARRIVAEVRAELGGRLSVSTTPGGIPPLQWFAFDTVTVDATGLIGERQSGRARSFIEDLGDGIALEMVEIPGGTFLMGSPEGEAERSDTEGPQHPVTVVPFYLGKVAVTQMQWRAVYTLPQVKRPLLPAPSRFKSAGRPVETISWHDAVEFCARLARMTRRNYRLPSEAEWEYTCRAGTATPFHFGETITPELENYNGNRPYGAAARGKFRGETTPAGSFLVANAFGLYDLHGNVWEWCADPWHEGYQGAPGDGRVWEDASGDPTRRVTRGGSWGSIAKACRSANRAGLRPDAVSEYLGFRVAVS